MILVGSTRATADYKRKRPRLAAKARIEPLVSGAAYRTNDRYLISEASRLARMPISITATTRNTAPTIQATGVE